MKDILYKEWYWPFTHQYAYSPYSSLYISYVYSANKEELVQQSRTFLVADHFLCSFYLNCGLQVILWGEIRCSSLLAVNGLIISMNVMSNNQKTIPIFNVIIPLEIFNLWKMPIRCELWESYSFKVLITNNLTMLW